MFRYFFVLLVFCLMLAGTVKAEFPIFPLWHPQTTGTTMTEYVYIPVAGPSIRWAEHAGFTIVLDDSRVYDNWIGKDQAPQVRLSLTNPAELAHLQDQDFVATVQVALEADRGCKYHAGLCVTLEDGTTMVWGPHGSGVVGDPGTDLRFRRPDGVNHWQSYGKTTVLLKLKRRYLTSPRRDVYSAWFSEDGHLWEKAAETTIDSADANEPVHVGVMLKNWGDTPHEELVTFKHFDI